MKITTTIFDSVRDNEVNNLVKMVSAALYNYNLETCLDAKELPLEDEITLDTASDERNLKVYAISKDSVTDISGERIELRLLDRDDIYTLQDIIHDTYDIDYLNA